MGFFEGIDSFIEFGSGPGTLSLHLENRLTAGTCIETATKAQHVHQELRNELQLKGKDIRWSQQLPHAIAPRTLWSSAYVLNEVSRPPEQIYKCDSILLIEPSTWKMSQQLIQIRKNLIERGFTVWAPCTHQENCPLMNQASDWCHDRIEFSAPEWFEEIEKYLPMKNRTLTFSYLAASKRPIPLSKAEASQSASAVSRDKTFRVIGDLLDERGKFRQMICRGPQREFLSWLKRDFPEAPRPLLSRGEAFWGPLDFEPKGPSELRIFKDKTNT